MAASPAPDIARAATPRGADRGRRAAAAPYAIPVALALAVHARTVGFPFVGLDDALHFTQNPLLVDPTAHGWLEHLLTRAIGYPMPATMATYHLDRALFGLRPWGSHLLNVVVHAVNVALVARLARGLGLGWRSATVAAALFAVHPLVVEPVSWVTGRKDLMATLWALTALGVAATRLTSRRLLVCACALFAMLSKPTSVTLPLLLGAVIASRHGAGRAGREARWLGPLAALGLALAVLGVVVCRGQQPVGSTGPGELVANVLGAGALAASHCVWPVDLLPYYFRWEDDPSAVAIVLGWLGILAVGAAALRLAPAGAPERVALAIAALAYVPVSGIAGHHRWTADSYLYLPLVGLVIAAAAGLERALSRRPPALYLALSGAIVAVLAGLSLGQAGVWRSPDAVWRPVVARYPQSPVALSELAATLQWMGRHDEATERYLELDDRFPEFEQVILPRARARRIAGDPARAVELLRRGVRAGDVPCAVAYLDWLLSAPAGVVARSPEDVRRAFALAWEPFVRRRAPPEALRALTDLLEASGLADEAGRVRDHRRRLPAR